MDGAVFSIELESLLRVQMALMEIDESRLLEERALRFLHLIVDDVEVAARHVGLTKLALALPLLEQVVRAEGSLFMVRILSLFRGGESRVARLIPGPLLPYNFLASADVARLRPRLFRPVVSYSLVLTC